MYHMIAHHKARNLSMVLFFLLVFFLTTPLHAASLLGKEKRLIQIKDQQRATQAGAVIRRPQRISYITMEANTNKVLHLRHVPDTMYLTNPTIATYLLKTPGILYLNALKPGHTKLMLVNNKGQITFAFDITITHRLSAVKKLLQATLPTSTSKLRFNSIDHHLIVSGKHVDRNKKSLINQLVQQIVPPTQIIDMTTISDHQDRPQVNLRVRIVEMDRTVKRALGLNFGLAFQTTRSALSFASPQLGMTGALSQFLIGVPGSTGAATTPGGINRGNYSLSALLNIMSDEKLLTSLAEPNLMLMPGVPATFQYGGQIPVVNSAAGTVGGVGTTTYKTYGINVSATAEILDNGIMRIQINPSVSEPTAPDPINNAIGLKTRSISTTIELKSGQSIAIAGLIESKTHQQESHIPGIDKIPLLSELTRSELIEREERELVFIVTPYLVHPTGSGVLDTPLDERGLPKGGAALAKPGFIIG